MTRCDPGQPSDEIRKHLGHLGYSDKELKNIEDLVHIQADIIVRGFWEKHKKQLSQGQKIIIDQELGTNLSTTEDPKNDPTETSIDTKTP